MEKSRFDAYISASRTVGGDYQKGYQAGLIRHASGSQGDDTSINEQSKEYRAGYKDGAAGKPPKGHHPMIGNTNAAAEVVRDTQMQVRLPSNTKAAYVKAAQGEGLKLSEWVVRELDKAAARYQRKAANKKDKNGADQGPMDLQ